MSIETVTLTTRNQTYDKPPKKKYEGDSPENTPSINPSPPPPSNAPLTIDKPSLDTMLGLPKSTIRNFVFSPSARAAHFYNIVEDLAQAPCTMSTLEVLQNLLTQRKYLFSTLWALYSDNSTTITFNVDNYKLRLSHQLVFEIVTRMVGRKVQ